MTVKSGLQLIMGILLFMVILPMNAITTYFLYKHVQAPSVVWTLWLIQLPVAFFMQVLKTIADKMDPANPTK